MTYLLKVECINDNWGMPPEIAVYVPVVNDGKKIPERHWVAEIKGFCDKYKYKRKFLTHKKDYSEANSTGTRGVYAYYILEDGGVYEVEEPVSWRNSDRYFCTVDRGQLLKLSGEEVDSWLSGTLTLMSTRRQKKE